MPSCKSEISRFTIVYSRNFPDRSRHTLIALRTDSLLFNLREAIVVLRIHCFQAPMFQILDKLKMALEVGLIIHSLVIWADSRELFHILKTHLYTLTPPSIGDFIEDTGHCGLLEREMCLSIRFFGPFLGVTLIVSPMHSAAQTPAALELI